MKNIIFDLGNVLLSFYPDEYLSQFYDRRTVEELMIIIFCSEEWVELDLGNMMIQDVIDVFCKEHPDYANEITFVLNNWTDMLRPLEKHVEIARTLKKNGYHLYVLSNFHVEAFLTMYHKYDFFNLFEGGIVSGFEHVLKPNEKIYHLLLDKYDLDPHECLFIDDSLSNIIAGERLGIDGIHLAYSVDLYSELKKKNIKL